MPAPLLYLPGLDGTGELLYRQQQLYRDFDVQTVAFPQDRTQSYEELAQLGIDRIESRGNSRPAVVLAESFGGAVALTLTLKRPDLVERLLLVNTFAYYPRRLWLQLAKLFTGLSPAKPSHPVTRWVRGPFFFSPDVAVADRDTWWDRTGKVPITGYGHRVETIIGLDLRPRLHEIEKPALVLVSPDDKVVPPDAGRYLSRHLPRAQLVEIRAGHAAMVHPQVDIAKMLADPSLWKGRSG